jgi:hypothetical protein
MTIKQNNKNMNIFIHTYPTHAGLLFSKRLKLQDGPATGQNAKHIHNANQKGIPPGQPVKLKHKNQNGGVKKT